MIYCKGKDCDQSSVTPFDNGLCDQCWSIESYKLSAPQLEAIKKECPACEAGRLHAVPDPQNDEVYLWCNNCNLSMDSAGGYIK